MVSQDVRTFSVFNYITLRAVLAAMTALFISFHGWSDNDSQVGTMKIGQSVRSDGPQSHLVKAGTPTMGGALILTSVAITTLLWGDLTNPYIWVVLADHPGRRLHRLGR
jgi:phospho-N-acetylmuramoyl-pentapeptide-transferase